MTACLVALAVIGASPARSNAEITVLIQELNASGDVVASQNTTLSSAGSTPLFIGQYFRGQASVETNSDITSDVASLIPGFSGRLLPAFDVSQDHTLKITVTDDNFIPNGPNGTLTIDVSGSNGFASGTETIVADTRLFNPADNSTIVLRPNLTSPDGSRVTDENISVNGLTSPYGIQQTLTLSFSGDIPANATFAATGGADLSSKPVPAPGGLVLALIGLPLIGLRRALRKRADAAV